MAPNTDTLALLHDHYKETFALIRDREGQRDKLFLWLLVIFALLVIEIQYPANVNGVLGHLKLGVNDIDLQQLPLSRLLNVSWVFTAAFVLRYCQATKAVERQYHYLHMLEERISARLKDADLYRREGRAYLDQYPHLLNWAWVYYTILFPAASVIAVCYLLGVEWVALNESVLSKLFDSAFGISVLISLGLYLFPRIAHRYGKKRGEGTGSPPEKEDHSSPIAIKQAASLGAQTQKSEAAEIETGQRRGKGTRRPPRRTTPARKKGRTTVSVRP